MVEFEEISESELRPLVEIAYKGDDDLLDKFWGDSFNFEEAVNATMDAINKYQEETNMKHYCVLKDGEEVGYVSCFPNNLYSFGVNINYRTKAILDDFWEQVVALMEESFICMLFSKNLRAIKFLKKMGMVEVNGVEENCTVLLYIKES